MVTLISARATEEKNPTANARQIPRNVELIRVVVTGIGGAGSPQLLSLQILTIYRDRGRLLKLISIRARVNKPRGVPLFPNS